MSVIDEVLKANEKYSQDFVLGRLPMPPARHLAILACMDARLTVEQFGGLKTGDAHIIRNAGGLVTDDALRSLLISHHLLGTREWMIIEHTDCGMLTFTDADLLERLEKQTGTAVHSPSQFLAFQNLEASVVRQVRKLRSHPWVPKEIVLRGFVYDVRSGKLKEIRA